jgi:tRNA(Ile)-lysidine synthase
MTLDLFDRVYQALEHEHRQGAGSPTVLLAMSGGLDSTVLLELLVHLCPQLGLGLAVAHIDHGLRKDSHLDANFCRRVAATYGIPCYVERIRVQAGGSIQSRARTARYAALAKIAEELESDSIITAHHADDAMETALLNLARGSSLDGLVSLRRQSPYPFPETPLRILRPLLSTSRAELEAFARSRQIAYRTDPTNLTDDYERNRLRHHLVPLLMGDRGMAGATSGLDHLRADLEALEHYTDKLSALCRMKPTGSRSVTLARGPLVAEPEATIARVLRRAYSSWSEATLSTAVELIRSPLPHSELSIPGAIFILRPDRLHIEPVVGRGRGDRATVVSEPARINIDQAGEVPYFDGVLNWVVRPPEPRDHQPDARIDRALFDLAALRELARSSPLELRGPRRGDRIRPLRMEGRKLVSETLREARIPPDLRWRWPCLAVDDTILWIPDVRRSNQALVSPETIRVLEMTWTREPDGRK